jgi:hypothetical protein
MRRKLSIATSKVVLIAAITAALMAHNGFEHIMGTVSKVSADVLTVKTAKGDVNVTLNQQTKLTRNNRPAQRDDLKPGTRVVVEVPEGKDKVAQSVKIGAATKK